MDTKVYCSLMRICIDCLKIVIGNGVISANLISVCRIGSGVTCTKHHDIGIRIIGRIGDGSGIAFT